MNQAHLIITHLATAAVTAAAFILHHRARVARILRASADALMAAPGTPAAGYFQALAEAAGVPKSLATLLASVAPTGALTRVAAPAPDTTVLPPATPTPAAPSPT